jgi:hypothetical protein
LLIAVMAVALVAAPAADAKLDPLPRLIKKQVTRALTKRGFDVKQVLPCRKKGPNKYRCEWRVLGAYPDGPEYSCSGFATYFPKRKRGKLRLDQCLNADLWNLLVEAGIDVREILNGKFEDGMWKYEWRAEGTRDGGVPYRCKDVAKYDRKAKQWTLGDCANEIMEADPLAAEPGPRPVFGIHDSWVAQENLQRVNRAVEVGAEVIRFNIVWQIAEPNKNQFNWGPYDVILKQVFAAGLKPLFVVIGAPCWAAENQNPPCSVLAPPTADHVDDFADFTAALARHYPTAFGIEIWNEPNWSEFWIPKPDPARYANMVRQAAAAVDATGTGIPVVTAGMSPLSNSSEDGTKIAFDEFMRKVFQEGGIGSADAIGSHIYFGDVDDYVLNMRQQIARLRQVMNANGAGSLPIWITEYGISSTEEATEENQGKILIDLYDTYRRLANIPVVIMYRMFDESNDHRGLINVNNVRKPAFCTVALGVGASPGGC